MDGWLLVFIILCIFYGPIYLMMLAAGYALGAMGNGGDPVFTARFTLMGFILGLPLFVTGYLAYRYKRY
ncbi:Hypothetical protein PACV_302 [Pacmanvirus A23]|uniref:Hypothetical protein n=1 Tax=Pacmanvirus A23 TaxID=1932881 RepID=UPI000A095844|nr:Hypothetical protein B9W72_gp298 [Pacmanvirus A23]SIP86015.1 Hypothetical protein PACV_302 [Pacmanvirus A23]